MGYYCGWGDARTMYSSEDEGYENRASAIRDKRGRVSRTLGETPTTLAPPISDDTDRQFWAEDELSNSESRQRLKTRRKRRHSLSYRNRAANRSRSRISRFSNSSSDSTHTVIFSKILKVQRHCRSKPKIEKLQSADAREASKGINGTTSCTKNESICSECQAISSMEQKSKSSRPESHSTSSHNNYREGRVDHTMQKVLKIRRKRMRGQSKRK